MKTIYNKQSNEIIGTVEGNSEAYDNETEGFLEGYYDAINYKIVDGVAVLRSENEKQSLISQRDVYTLESLRSDRDDLLAASDWTQSPDSPLSDNKKAEWATYRQQLRDLPANTSDPANPSWPENPS
tara:strand:- start:99 stop:479 length:381 start_codon:yes stop_codon:yes gene_type:complete